MVGGRDTRYVLYFIQMPQVRPERFELPTVWFEGAILELFSAISWQPRHRLAHLLDLAYSRMGLPAQFHRFWRLRTVSSGTQKLLNETDMLISSDLTQCHQPTGMKTNSPGSITVSRIETRRIRGNLA
jgi:hypothetical protein